MNRTFEKKSDAELVTMNEANADEAWSYVLVYLAEEIASCYGDESEGIAEYVADLEAYSEHATEVLAGSL